MPLKNIPVWRIFATFEIVLAQCFCCTDFCFTVTFLYLHLPVWRVPTGFKILVEHLFGAHFPAAGFFVVWWPFLFTSKIWRVSTTFEIFVAQCFVVQFFCWAVFCHTDFCWVDDPLYLHLQPESSQPLLTILLDSFCSTFLYLHLQPESSQPLLTIYWTVFVLPFCTYIYPKGFHHLSKFLCTFCCAVTFLHLNASIWRVPKFLLHSFLLCSDLFALAHCSSSPGKHKMSLCNQISMLVETLHRGDEHTKMSLFNKKLCNKKNSQ